MGLKYYVSALSMFHEMYEFPPDQTEGIQTIEECTIETKSQLAKSAEFVLSQTSLILKDGNCPSLANIGDRVLPLVK